MTDLPYCKNCNCSVEANFCPDCGQRQYIRINRNYILNEAQETLIQTNRGFLYTILCLIKNPGKTAREYIDGKRAAHYKPLPLLFLLSTISVFISFKLLDLKEASLTMNENLYGKNDVQTNIVEVASNYSSFIVLLTIPFLALTSYFAFKRYEHNYYEHIIANAYFYSYITIISIFLFTPLNQYFRTDPIALGIITFAAMLIPFVIYIWFWKGFYPELELFVIIKHLAIQFLLTVALMICLFILGISTGFLYAKILN